MGKFMNKITDNHIFLSLNIFKCINFTIGWGLEHDLDCSLGFHILDLQRIRYGWMNIFTIGIWLLRISCSVSWS